MTVECYRNVVNKIYIFSSVTMSMFDVASSRITTCDLRKMALHMQISCFSPELRLLPFSAMAMSRSKDKSVYL